jgi:uncharacterized protein (TIGR02266 family)
MMTTPVTVDERVSERRAGERVALEVEVSFASESNFFTGLTGDISAGGIFVSTYKTCPIGSRVALEFTLPGGTIFARGTVRWARDATQGSTPGVGISLEELTPEQLGWIQSFCLERPPLYYEVEELTK